MQDKAKSEPGGQVAFRRLVAYRVAMAAGLFSIAVILLLLMSFHELRQNDPMSSGNARKLDELVAQQRLNPEDEFIRKDIQVLDQQIRQNYFNAQAKIRTGAYLLVAGLCVFVICMRLSPVRSVKT
ncbi:MAG TPA: hypothetical protein DET40_01695 [Lentisphaeria bacterium]|nr:MAG: hypothetical protein A2X45_17025 [Lentisphaerae bacterium GWF2_50_93]HCE42246.1 hypothetical protein [Lentisphaeria bacterium]